MTYLNDLAEDVFEANRAKGFWDRERPLTETTMLIVTELAEAFVGPCPEGMESCHADDDRNNNRLENLRWGTHAENCEERRTNGRTPRPATPPATCRQGHTYPVEPRRDRNGHRICEPCANAKRDRRRNASRPRRHGKGY